MLEVVGLHCTRGYHTLFDDLDFTLNSGQLLLVEGHNGSGKTSLLKILGGLRPADAGEVLWQQQPIRQWGAEYRRQFIWLGHQNGIKDDLTALENLRGMVVNHPTSSAKIISLKSVLEKIGLAGNANRYPRHFSAGMKRRLALCRLLLSDAPLWILDEPQAALDKSGIQLFESLLEEHLERGGSAIMTSHHEVGVSGAHVKHLSLAA